MVQIRRSPHDGSLFSRAWNAGKRAVDSFSGRQFVEIERLAMGGPHVMFYYEHRNGKQIWFDTFEELLEYTDNMNHTLRHRLEEIAMKSVQVLAIKNKQYGESWCKRGGQQAFAVIVRKWDRIEAILQQMENGYDIFEAWNKNPGDVRDDIRDLRDYLFLLEEYMTRDERESDSADEVANQIHMDKLKMLVCNSCHWPVDQCVCNMIDSDKPNRGYVDQD